MKDDKQERQQMVAMHAASLGNQLTSLENGRKLFEDL